MQIKENMAGKKQVAGRWGKTYALPSSAEGTTIIRSQPYRLRVYQLNVKWIEFLRPFLSVSIVRSSELPLDPNVRTPNAALDSETLKEFITQILLALT